MRVVNHASLAPDRLIAIENELPEHGTLLEVIKWGLAHPKGTFTSRVIAEVVVQDEFTHDAVVPWRDGLFLVYGTT